MNSFNELRLPPTVTRALEALQFQTPTPIQSQAIPTALTGQDLIGNAQTGTGKTAAFCIPTLTRLLQNPTMTALILAPTREIAQQIEIFFRSLSRFNPEVRSTLIIGGQSMQPQTRALSKRPRVIVATPGRLLDHMDRRSVTLTNTGVLILDEADRMLDMGFAPQLNQILAKLPKTRQSLLFSATWGPEVDRLSKRTLTNPARISVGEVSKAATTIQQSVVTTTVKDKNDTLLDELNQRKGSILIFARTKSRTDRVARYLNTYGVEAHRIHGGRSQAQRNAALNAFRTGKARVLVATDIAARGIDVADIAHVINYDLPQLPEDYIHRIGRTGRAGSTGQAISLLTPEDRSQWNEITRILKRTGSSLPQGEPAKMHPQRPALAPRRPEQNSRKPWHSRGNSRRIEPKRA